MVTVTGQIGNMTIDNLTSIFKYSGKISYINTKQWKRKIQNNPFPSAAFIPNIFHR